MMNFEFKTHTGKKFSICACDLEQARVLAYSKGGPEFYRADLVGMNNRIA